MGFFGKSIREERKELSETTMGGFERPSPSLFKPTAEAVKERIKAGVEKIGEEQQEFRKAKTKQRKKRFKAQAKEGFSLKLSPAIMHSRAPKHKKSQVEKLIGI